MATPPEKSPTVRGRALRAFAGSLPGIALGLFCYTILEYGVGASLFVGVVGAFIGAALAQPDVSTRNVLWGTAGTIAAYNAPGFMKQDILDTAFKDTPQPPESASTEPSHPTSSPQRSQPSEPLSWPPSPNKNETPGSS